MSGKNIMKKFWSYYDAGDKAAILYVMFVALVILSMICRLSYLRYAYPEAYNHKYMVTEIHKEFPNGKIYELDRPYIFCVIDSDKVYIVRNTDIKSPRVTDIKEANKLSPF